MKLSGTNGVVTFSPVIIRHAHSPWGEDRAHLRLSQQRCTFLEVAPLAFGSDSVRARRRPGVSRDKFNFDSSDFSNRNFAGEK